MNSPTTTNDAGALVGSASIESLKSEYLQGLHNLSTGVHSLREAVVRLLNLGVARRDLVQWAVNAGYSQSHVRNLLSKLLKGTAPARKPGAGRFTTHQALAILAFATEHFGERGFKFCLSAYRAGKARLAFTRSSSASNTVTVLARN